MISSTTNRVSYTGDGSSTDFTIPWLFYANSDILVLVNGSVLGSGYTITGAGVGSGTLSITRPPDNGVNVQIVLNPPRTQLANLVDGTAFPSATLNQVNDRIVQIAQRLYDLITRCINVPDGDVSPVLLLPSAANRASKALVFDSSGNVSVAVDTPSGTLTKDSVVACMTYFQHTAAEIAAGVTPVDYSYPPGYTQRYSSASHALSQADHGGAPIVSADGGFAVTGQVGSVGLSRSSAVATFRNRVGVNTSAVVNVQNTYTDGTGEAAFSFEGKDSSGNDIQYCGWFARPVSNNNDPVTRQSVVGLHVSDPTHDWMQFGAWGNNSVRTCGPAITANPWNDVPPDNCHEVYTYLWARTGLRAGPNLLPDGGTGNMTSGYGLEIQGLGQVGDVTAGAIDHAVQFGYSSGGSTCYLQAYRNSTSAYLPLLIQGSAINFAQGDLKPTTNNALNLGSNALGWKNIYSVNAVTVTSDQRLKNDLGPILDSELAWGKALKGMIRKFALKSDPDQKILFGVYAQEVVASCESFGLDPSRYGFIVLEEGQYGVKYEPLLAFIVGCL